MDRDEANQLHRVIDQLTTAPIGELPREALDPITSGAARLRAFADAIDVAVARRVASFATSLSSESAAEALSQQGRRTRASSRAAQARAELCARMPEVEAALRSGEIGTEHVDALVAAVRNLEPIARDRFDQEAASLVSRAASVSIGGFTTEARDLARFLQSELDRERAAAESPDREVDHAALVLERQRMDSRVNIWTDKASGMVKLFAELDPVTGSSLVLAVEDRLRTVKQRDETSGIPIDRLRVDALMELVTAPRSNDPEDRRVPEVIVVTDVETLLHGVHEHSLCELSDGTAVPISTLRRLCCEAEVVPAVLDSAGRPLDIGRGKRVATRDQRRALKAAYRTCGIPGCDVPFDRCQIHHLKPWEEGGATDLSNILPVCLGQHHLVHEGGFTLTMDDDRVVTLIGPDGVVVSSELTCDRWPPGQHRPKPSESARSKRGSGRDPDVDTDVDTDGDPDDDPDDDSSDSSGDDAVRSGPGCDESSCGHARDPDRVTEIPVAGGEVTPGERARDLPPPPTLW